MDLPIKHCDFPISYVNVYQRVSASKSSQEKFCERNWDIPGIPYLFVVWKQKSRQAHAEAVVGLEDGLGIFSKGSNLDSY